MTPTTDTRTNAYTPHRRDECIEIHRWRGAWTQLRLVFLFSFRRVKVCSACIIDRSHQTWKVCSHQTTHTHTQTLALIHSLTWSVSNPAKMERSRRWRDDDSSTPSIRFSGDKVVNGTSLNTIRIRCMLTDDGDDDAPTPISRIILEFSKHYTRVAELFRHACDVQMHRRMETNFRKWTKS